MFTKFNIYNEQLFAREAYDDISHAFCFKYV